MGDLDGKRDGTNVGLVLGLKDGTPVGVRIGAGVGMIVGNSEGSDVGNPVGIYGRMEDVTIMRSCVEIIVRITDGKVSNKKNRKKIYETKNHLLKYCT